MRNLAIISAVVFIAGFLSSGCRPPTMTEVIGTYTYSNNVVVDKIVLRADGTFKEAVNYADGRAWTITDTWTLKGFDAELNTCYQVFDDDQMTAELKPVVLKEPKLWGMCNFEWEGNGFSRYDHHFLWKKDGVP